MPCGKCKYLHEPYLMANEEGIPEPFTRASFIFVRIHQNRVLRYEALALFIRDAVVERDINLRASHKYNVKPIAVVMRLGRLLIYQTLQ